MTTTHFVIMKGPSMDRLVDAFRYANTLDVKLDVDFTVHPEGGGQVEWLHVRVSSLSYVSNQPNPHVVKIIGNVKERTSGQISINTFEASYDTEQRTGTLTATS